MDTAALTEISVAAVAGLALIIVAIIQTAGKRKGTPQKSEAEVARENQLVEQVATPIAPGGDRHDAAGLLALSITLADLQKHRLEDRAELDSFKAEHKEIKSRLSVLEHSYPLLYRWAKRHIEEWDELRLLERPIPLPEGIHHPN